jgi:lipopolysaccharide transport system ATP-binding protein
VSDIVIKVQELGKRYTIPHERGGSYVALRDVITQKACSIWRTQGVPLRSKSLTQRVPNEEFWALRGVSFDIRRGEVWGIIGRNGAGKSTLLKILSRITEPTEGRVRIRGRVASLLEIGTGFHPELTGRENIFLNGAILGMRRGEIKRKFDEIVAFAEVEKFLDTPVKRYSSGMYVRLAFAVAAYLDPEILIVDEVLAVGDAAFQKRCLGRMGVVAQSGRTVIFVSHNMNAVESLCRRALLLEKGCVVDQGTDVRALINRYTAGDQVDECPSVWLNTQNAFNHSAMQPLFFAIVNEHGQNLVAPARNDDRLFVVIHVDVRQLDPALNVGFALLNQNSDLLLWSLTTDACESEWPKLVCGFVELRCALPTRFLNEGSYRLEMIASLHCRDWFVRPGHNSPSVHFEIRGGLSDSPYWMFARPGLLAPEWKWVSRTLGERPSYTKLA